jgi:hypothetical protein
MRRFPLTLAQELRFKARWKWRTLGWRLRHPSPTSNVLRRAWYRTDPHDIARVFASFSDNAEHDVEPTPPPAPGTTVRLSGELNQGRVTWGELLLGKLGLDDAVTEALGLTATMPPFPVEITVHVTDTAARNRTSHDADR